MKTSWKSVVSGLTIAGGLIVGASQASAWTQSPNLFPGQTFTLNDFGVTPAGGKLVGLIDVTTARSRVRTTPSGGATSHKVIINWNCVAGGPGSITKIWNTAASTSGGCAPETGGLANAITAIDDL